MFLNRKTLYAFSIDKQSSNGNHLKLLQKLYMIYVRLHRNERADVAQLAEQLNRNQ